ncbi:unnamed protein product [Tuber aestivum]|uniref:catalase n=1 Tax=Tuber aestivum TaxID=59557 RepID=A0A292Q9Y5_9PEZI|nr:unnamed protein product [Tuber aestivum]
MNHPVCPVMNFKRDRTPFHRIYESKVNYWPNRFVAYELETVSCQEYATKVVGLKLRIKGAKFPEHYSQVQFFFNSLTKHEKTDTHRRCTRIAAEPLR